MKNNLIQIIKILLFSIIFLLLYIYIEALMKPDTVELRNIAGFYGEKRNSLDVVYIGGSAAFVYWEPLKAWEDSGITSYNFASNTIQVEFYKYLVKETLKTQKPKVIILDARAFQYRDVDQPPTEVAYRNVLTATPFSIERYEFIEDNVPKYLNEDTLSYHFDLIKYHGADTENSIVTAFQILTNNYRNELKGFCFIPKVEKMPESNFKTNKETPLSNETNKIFDDLLKYLKTINTKVLFVVSPYFETEQHKENFNYVERKVKENGFDFLDTNEYYYNMGINFNTDFYNTNHVNIFGADKYTDFLSKYLKEKYNLPDKRNIDKYSKEWNSLLDNWHYNINATKNEINASLGGE